MKMNNFRSFDFNDQNDGEVSNGSKMCSWKSVAIFTGAVLLVLCIFFGGFYAGRTSVIDSLGDGIQPQVEESTVRPTVPPPEIDWDGVCPRRSGICPTTYRGNPLLLLISLDGFRPDYLERGFMPTLHNLSRCGTRAPYMYPVFPSKTFPNHYSQVTGLNPVSHGIIDNTMYDPIQKKLFKLGTAEASKPYWWSAEPIWVTAEKQGKKAGCFFWPGSDVKINLTFPTYYKKYSSKIPYPERVQTVLSWIDKPVAARPSFFTLYVNQPDHAAHVNGTNSDSVNIQLRNVDDMITMLYAGLQERSLLDCINVIIVSDHGMADTSCDKMISLNKYLNISEVYAVAGPFGRIRLRGQKNITAEQNVLESLQCGDSHMRAYRKENLPVRYHYASNPRIEPLFLDLDNGWMISNYDTGPNSSFCQGGNHGYDNLYEDMRASFFAIGPSFKSNHVIEPFMNTELYEMMAELLNITARLNNGTRGSLHHLLNDPELLPPQPQYEPPSTLKIPSNPLDIEMNFRGANCSVAQVIDKLNMTDIEINKTMSDHLPFGIPHRHFDGDTIRLLHHSDYVSGYDVKYKLPLWTSYTISRKANFSEEVLQWIADARMPFSEDIKCSYYHDPKVVNNSVLQRPLFPPRFVHNGDMKEASLLTNSVPKTQDHVDNIEKTFHDMLSEWVEEDGTINIVTGPAFDVLNTNVYPGVDFIMQSHDKYGPLVVPTHYYAVVTWCKSDSTGISDCEPSNLDVVAFLLPNDPVPNNCEPPKEMIAKNAARVVDIEVLTGISFFTKLPVYDAIRLRTAVPQRQFTS